MVAAMVPPSIIGKIGRSHDGMNFWSGYVCAAKRKEYWKDARQNVRKTYTQKAMAMLVTIQPRVGWFASYDSTIYFCVPVMMVATERKNGPRKRPSRS